MTIAVTSAAKSQVATPALDLRRMFMALLGGEGVRTPSDMKASQRGAGANMSVDIAAGLAMVLGDDIAFQGPYMVYNDATFNLTGFSAADPTNPRIDRVVLRVRDAFHGSADNTDAFAIRTGTPTGGATLANVTGAAALGNGELLIANVLIPATATSITTANIDSGQPAQSTAVAVRPLIAPAGGVAPPYVGVVGGEANDVLVANSAYLVPFWVPVAITVTKLNWYCTGQSGNYDVGIYDSAFNRIVSKGSTACPVAGQVATTVTATALQPGAYYMAFAFDNAVASIRGGNSWGPNLVKVKATSFPLPATISTPSDAQLAPSVAGTV